MSGKEKGGSVLKSIYKLSGFIAIMAWSCMASATGLGGINVSSSLGQPLRAEIELVSVDKADSSSISAKLASPRRIQECWRRLSLFTAKTKIRSRQSRQRQTFHQAVYISARQ